MFNSFDICFLITRYLSTRDHTQLARTSKKVMCNVGVKTGYLNFAKNEWDFFGEGRQMCLMLNNYK